MGRGRGGTAWERTLIRRPWETGVRNLWRPRCFIIARAPSMCACGEARLPSAPTRFWDC